MNRERSNVCRALAPPALLFAVFAALPGAGHVGAQVRYDTVARSGQPAPGLPAGLTYANFFGTPSINNTGQVAYYADVTGSGVTFVNDATIYAGPFAAPQLLAREGSPASGAPAGVNYAGFALPLVNDAGQAAYLAHLSGGGVTPANNQAIYAGPVAEPQLRARKGDPAPGTPAGVNYSSFNAPVLNDAGEIAYAPFLSGAGVDGRNDRAIYAGSFAAPQLLARGGDPAPGTPAGVNYVVLPVPALNDAGQMAFGARLAGPDVTTANDDAIFAGPRAAPLLVAREGAAAPGTPAGVNYLALGVGGAVAVFNDAGRVAYLATLNGVGVTTANERAIYAGNFAAPQLLARGGAAAPGTSAGVNYLRFGLPALNEPGGIAYSATLSGAGVTAANNEAIYAGPFAAAQLLARTGNAAPGTPTGVHYSSFGSPGSDDWTFFDPTLNDAGQVVYLAGLGGAGVTSANDSGLFVFDPTLGGLLIAREGEGFDVDPTAAVDLRTIANGGIGFMNGRHDDWLTGLSNDGTLVFCLGFTDGTGGIFTAAVPEPAGLTLLGLAARALLRRRRPRSAAMPRLATPADDPMVAVGEAVPRAIDGRPGQRIWTQLAENGAKRLSPKVSPTVSHESSPIGTDRSGSDERQTPAGQRDGVR